ncbi:MAG: hypothetical protein ACREYE_14530 [Gammaproteobacteria bacterium]
MKVARKGKRRTEWVAMRKGVAYLFRYPGVSLQANGRYLDALALVDNPTNAKRELDRVTTPKKDAAGRRCSGFNPLARHDSELVQALMAGERCLRGFSNHDIRARLAATVHLRAGGQDPEGKAPRSAGPFAGSTLTGPIAKIPRTRRWRVTLRTPRHGNAALSARPPLSGGVFQNRRMICFVECKEVTVKESIPRI